LKFDKKKTIMIKLYEFSCNFYIEILYFYIKHLFLITNILLDSQKGQKTYKIKEKNVSHQPIKHH